MSFPIGLQSSQPPLQILPPTPPQDEPRPRAAKTQPPPAPSKDADVSVVRLGPNGLAEDQPPTAQGKMRTRVYVACLQWFVASSPDRTWFVLNHTHPFSAHILAAHAKFDVMARNQNVRNALGGPVTAIMTPRLSVGALIRSPAHGSERVRNQSRSKKKWTICLVPLPTVRSAVMQMIRLVRPENAADPVAPPPGQLGQPTRKTWKALGAPRRPLAAQMRAQRPPRRGIFLP